MKKFRILAVMLCLVMSFSLVGCKSIGDPGIEGIKKYGELVVATSPDFPPFEYLGEGNKIVGWDIEMAENFAREIGVKLKVVSMDFASVVIAPQNNKAHIGMAGLSANPEREKVLDFTKTVYDSHQVMVVKDTNTDVVNGLSLAGKKVGAQSGTVGHMLAQYNADWVDDTIGKASEAKGYDNCNLAVKDVANGKIDIAIVDILPAQKIVAATAGVKIVSVGTAPTSIFDDSYVFTVKKGNTGLRDELNRLIDLFRANGVMDALNAKYLQ